VKARWRRFIDTPERWVAWVALLPIPTWFVATAILAEPAAWRETYRSTPDGAVAAEVYERRLSHVWSGKFFASVPGGVSPTSFAAQFEACLTLDEARSVPLMLVANGHARLDVDGEEVLVATSEGSRRAVSGKEVAFSAGTHHVRVEYSTSKRASVGLLASWDGRAPKAIESGRVAPGVRVFRPRAGDSPCGER
jgi:hypothetical protein